MTTGYYSLIQYCPDLSRLEAVNIGVVLFCPEPHYLGTKLVQNSRRVRKCFGAQAGDGKQLEIIRASIAARLAAARGEMTGIDDLVKFAAIQANSVVLTPPRRVLVGNPAEELNRLFDRLVGSNPGRRSSEVRDVLEQEFSAPAYQPIIARRLSVVVPVFRRAVTIPYGFQNGRFNLIRPARFVGDSPTELISLAGGLAVEGELLFTHRDEHYGDMQLVVVGQFPRGGKDVNEAVRRVLKEHHTRLYALEDTPRLFEEIRASAKPLRSRPVGATLPDLGDTT